MRLSSERPQAWRDLLFAATVVFAISGVRAPHFHTPIFVLFSVLVLAASYRSMVKLRLTGRFLVLPLACFLCWHLYEAFRLGRHNGLIFTLQAASVSIFVLAFVNRYSQVPMRRFLAYSGVGYTLLLAFVVGYHVLHHRIVSYKFLADPKAVFDLLPLMLVVNKRTKGPKSLLVTWIIPAAFVLFLFLSGERKAYILLILFSPLLINLRSPITYVLPLVLLAATPVVLSFEKTGYVARQIGTLEDFSNGKVTKTSSNELRQSAVEIAWRLFKEHPADGVGTNGFPYEMYQRTGEADGTHNEWMRVLSENGIVGFTFYAWTVLYGLFGLFRKRTWGRTRSINERIIASCLFLTLVMYFSFEAIDFIVVTAFVLTPFVQFLRLDPDELVTVLRRSGLKERRAQLVASRAPAMVTGG